MARRYFLSTARSISLSVLLAAPPAAIIVAPLAAPLGGLNVCRAEDAPADVANSKNSALATINADGVYIRSGPGDSYYPTTKLSKDTPVTVVGEKFDWLKIVPPENSFCYVAKAFIDKNPDGSAASNRDEVNVRAGSELNTIKTSVSTKLHAGEPVKILGEVDEYYKIAPPADAYVYVKKDYVELKKLIPQVAQKTAPTGPDAAPIPTADGSRSAVALGATTQPAGAAPTEVASATTQPSGGVAVAETSFDKLEAQFTDASTKTIEQQPLDEMTAGYNKLIADASLPTSMKQIAEFRLQTLKARSAARDEFVATQKQQAEAKQKQVAMKAEQEEIAQQIKDKDVQVYAAVGTLRTSSLQQGSQTLYRLTDPQTGRTVCYLSSNDAKYGTLLGQFIGVKGAVSSDAGLNMKVVTPTEFAAVDPNQLYRGIAAQIVPPSLLPQATTVSPQLAEPASGTDKPQASAGDK